MINSSVSKSQIQTDRKIAVLVGILFLFSIVMSFVGSGMIESCLNAKNVFAEITAKSSVLLTGVLMEFAMNISLICAAFLLLPILKRYNSYLAYGYLSLRIVEVSIVLIGALSPLLLVALNQQFTKAGMPVESYFQNIAILLTQGYFKARYISMIIIGISGLMLSHVLYWSRLVPCFISVIGFLGYGLLFVISPLLVADIFSLSGILMFFLMPCALFEIVLFPFWLIFKGFSADYIPKKETI